MNKLFALISLSIVISGNTHAMKQPSQSSIPFWGEVGGKKYPLRHSLTVPNQVVKIAVYSDGQKNKEITKPQSGKIFDAFKHFYLGLTDRLDVTKIEEVGAELLSKQVTFKSESVYQKCLCNYSSKESKKIQLWVGKYGVRASIAQVQPSISVKIKSHFDLEKDPGYRKIVIDLLQTALDPAVDNLYDLNDIAKSTNRTVYLYFFLQGLAQKLEHSAT